MQQLISSRVPFVPVSRDLFGADGKDSIVAMVQQVVCDGTSLGRHFTDGHSVWTHPALLAEKNGLVDTFCWYRLTLEEDMVVVRRDTEKESHRPDERVFQARPCKVGWTPVEHILLLSERIHGMRGRCGCGDGCLADHDAPDSISPRDAVLVELEPYSNSFQAICGECYDRIVVEDPKLRERVLVDGRCLLPHAPVQTCVTP